ncbi:hypothetical protein BJ973_002755 [Actinoplanes tereljensis]|nr:nuclear transport factor 2 family protein [Actinoplanes tereljensis]
MAGFTEDAWWVTSVVRGRGELTEFFAAAMAGLPPTLMIQDLLAAGDRAACQLTVAGKEQTFSIAGFYRLRGDRIESARIYREGNAEIS